MGHLGVVGVIGPWHAVRVSEHTFDYAGLVARLACRSTAWLAARRDELVAEQLRLRVEERRRPHQDHWPHIRAGPDP
jgi:hypothetical protein